MGPARSLRAVPVPPALARISLPLVGHKRWESFVSNALVQHHLSLETPSRLAKPSWAERHLHSGLPIAKQSEKMKKCGQARVNCSSSTGEMERFLRAGVPRGVRFAQEAGRRPQGRPFCPRSGQASPGASVLPKKRAGVPRGVRFAQEAGRRPQGRPFCPRSGQASPGASVLPKKLQSRNGNLDILSSVRPTPASAAAAAPPSPAKTSQNCAPPQKTRPR